MTNPNQESEQLLKILNRIIRRCCGTCRWFYRYTGDPCGDVGHCEHSTPVTPTRGYHNDDYEGSLTEEDSCAQWQHKDREIAAALDCIK